MALDPNIILHASDAFNKLPNYGEVMAQRTAIQDHQRAVAEHESALAQQQADRTKSEAMQAGRVKLGQLAASGDYAGARSGALGAGDLELVKQLDGMADEDRKRTFEITQNTAPLLLSLRKLPPEQRAAGLQQIAPQLQSAGFTPDHIAQVGADLSDGALDRVETSAMTIAQYQESRKPFTLGQYDRRFDASGKMIAEGAQPTKYQLDPETGQVIQIGGPGVTAGATAGPASRTAGGWTPRARNGGDNSDAAVDGKINGMSAKLGIGPDDNLTGLSAVQIAEALTLSEGGRGSIADRNNNPANIKNADGTFKRFPTRQVGLQAAAAMVERKIARGQTTIKTLVEGLPAAGPPAAPRRGKPPSGFEWQPDGSLQPIAGGPADKSQQLPRVPPGTMKDFNDNRSSIRQMAAAKSSVISYKKAVGGWNALTPDFLAQRIDPKGVETRAMIANIGSLIIHDRSGAAVTVSEYPRLKPFIPMVSDTPEAIVKKLDNLSRILGDMNSDMVAGYSNNQGESQLDRVNNSGSTKNVLRIKNADEYHRLPSGTAFLAPGETRTRVKP